jgi:hypothetical protein
MSLILDTLKKKPKEAKRLLGISYEQFDKLVNLAKQLHEHQIELREKEKVRINRSWRRKQIQIICRRPNLIDDYLFET